MTISYNGNLIVIIYNAEDTPEDIQLLDGYSFEQIQVIGAQNINEIVRKLTFIVGSSLSFPPVNSKSPCVIHPVKSDPTKSAYIRLLIEKFGQIPDANYFDKAFDPILVTGEDDKEYNIIPSNQFK